MTTSNFNNYTWINCERDYLKFLDGSNTIPLLLPTSPVRKQRWESVLNSYGMYEKSITKTDINDDQDISYLTVESFSSLKRRNQKNLIILLSTEFVYPTYFYAKKTNRCLIVIKCLEEINHLLKHNVPQSILFIDIHYKLTNDKLKRISNIIYNISIDIQWGIITAKDKAGISFIFTKFLTNNEFSNEIAALDIINKRILNTEIKEENYSSKKIVDYCNRYWKNLCIVAHGEGAHANLESVVLCGISDEIEKDMRGTPIKNGCTIHKCKRVQNKEIKTLPVFNMKVENSIFLSCNGFSVAGDLFPSDLSYVLCGTEGYIKNIITTTEVQSFHKDVCELFLHMLKSNIELGNIVNIFNDILKNVKGSYPYILFGDPYLTKKVNTSGEDNNTKNNIEYNSKDTFTILKKDIINDQHIYIFNQMKEDSIPFIGNKYLLYLNNRHSIEENIIIDKTEELKEIIENLNNLFLKVHSLKLIEDQLFMINRAVLQDEHNQLNKVFSHLTITREKLTLCIERFFIDINNMHSNQYWDQKVFVKYEQNILKLTTQLYKSYLLLFSNKSILKSLDLVLFNHYYHTVTTTTEKCSRCKSLLNVHSLKSKLNNTPPRLKHTCPVCGLVRNVSKTGSFIDLELLSDPKPGEKLSILMKPNLGMNIYNSIESYLICEITDKSNGETIDQFTLSGHLTSEPIYKEVLLPSDIGSDLHTIRIVLISNYDISYSRFRFPICNTIDRSEDLEYTT